jgi:hypothetical protein
MDANIVANVVGGYDVNVDVNVGVTVEWMGMRVCKWTWMMAAGTRAVALSEPTHALDGCCRVFHRALYSMNRVPTIGSPQATRQKHVAHLIDSWMLGWSGWHGFMLHVSVEWAE